mmetsp:Transcript_2772/g.6747  ORF Transcript_2772/g.6747 Transcript_2772/m.6747 type:complete len:383 (+) Transcript_2772:2557-3705(+)
MFANRTALICRSLLCGRMPAAPSSKLPVPHFSHARFHTRAMHPLPNTSLPASAASAVAPFPSSSVLFASTSLSASPPRLSLLSQLRTLPSSAAAGTSTSLLFSTLSLVDLRSSLRTHSFSSQLSASLLQSRSIHQSPATENVGGGSTPRGEKGATAQSERVRSTGLAALAVIVALLGLSYAAVPLYSMFCQATGYAGTTNRGNMVKDLDQLRKEDPRLLDTQITVRFHTNVAKQIPWEFRPCQDEVTVLPGEKVLVFFNATNYSKEPVIGVATYNVVPPQAGVYFTKVQCFCFDEQQLNPEESVDMPVYFYIDPEIVKDKRLRNLKDITLSYTFWRAYGDGNDEEYDYEELEYDEEQDEVDYSSADDSVDKTPSSSSSSSAR